MKIPSKIRILGEDYNIKIVKELPGNLLGTCEYAKKLITIQKDKNKGNMVDTLIHEVVHGIIHESGAFSMLDDGTEEILCYQIAKTLAKLLA